MTYELSKIIINKKGVGRVLVYRIDIIKALKEVGYNSTRILKENILSQSAMQKLRKNEMIGIKTLEQLCNLLDMQPGDIIENKPKTD